MSSYLFERLRQFHQSILIRPTITAEELVIIRNNMMVDKTTICRNVFKNIYKSIVNYVWIFTLNPIKLKKDKTFIDDLLTKQNLDMTEIRRNSKTIPTTDYPSLLRYNTGDCWINCKLSNGIELDDNDKKMIDHINHAVDNTTPLSYPIALFHGFELFTKYDDHNFKIGDIINNKGFLSKTPSFDVACRFALTQDTSNPKFFIVNYPANTKHINLDIRPHNEEYEYLSNSNEFFKIIDICHYHHSSRVLTFFVCDIVIKSNDK